MGAPKALTPRLVQRIGDDIRVDFVGSDESMELDEVAGTNLRRLCTLLKIRSGRDWSDVQRRLAITNFLDGLLGVDQDGACLIENDEGDQHSGEADHGSGEASDGDKSDGASEARGEADGDDNGVTEQSDGGGGQSDLSFMVSVGGEPNWLPAEVVAQMFGGGGPQGSGEPPSWDAGAVPEWSPQPDKRPDERKSTVDESPVHHKLPEVLSLLAAGRSVYLWGEKGSGKSTAGIEYAKMIGSPLYAISGHPHLMRGEFVGALLPSGPHDGPLVQAARDGILLFDEIDNTSPSSVTQMNLVLANGFISTAGGETLEAHAGFRVIATANTNGQGATTEFVGRNKLDSATLDRFVSIEWGTDYALERYIVRRTLGLELSVANEWLELCHAMRKNITDYALKCGVSMRNVIDGAKTLSIQATDDWAKTNLPRLDVMALARGLVLAKLPEDQQIKVLTGL